MYLDPEIPLQAVPEKVGIRSELSFLAEEDWVQNTEVKYLIQHRRGRWLVFILFFCLEIPLRILVKKIDDYHSLQKAETYAKIFQRGIRKDARGTLKRKKHAYHICLN